MNKLLKYGFYALAMSIFVQLQAQTNVDSIFNKAILLSQKSAYNDAIYEATKAIKADSNRADMHVFIANVYSWKNSNDTALIYLNNARKLNYLNDDFYESALNILIRAQKNDSVLKVCDEAAAKGYKNTKDLTLKRLIVYDSKKDYEKIIELSEKKENEAFLDDKIVDDIVSRAKLNFKRRMVAVDYSLDLIENSDPHHFFSASYTTKVKSVSTTIGLNYAARFAKKNVQLEYTGYKTLQSKNYWYLNYGYALGSELFPKHRAGLEYYLKLSSHWDASLGGRYLFYPLTDDKNIFILTGNIGAYFKNNWFTIRPFLVLRETDKSLSFSAKYRLYASNPANYWGLELGFGNSPDDTYTMSQGSFNQLMSYRVKIEKNIRLSDNHQLFIASGFVFEEFAVNSAIDMRSRFVFDVGYRYLF